MAGERRERPDREAFGAALRRHRRAAGLTQEALAERAGISVRGLQHLEAGDALPYRATARAVADALGLAGPARRRFEAACAQRQRSRLADAAHDDRDGARPGGAPGALPAPLTSLVGREQELAAVRELVLRPDVRLVTLTGAPGIGKTRLAEAVAAGLLPAFPDGVWFVPLAPVTDADHVLPAVAHALGVRDEGRRARREQETLSGALRERRALLVLDNCEQVLAAAPRVAALLSACPQLKVLATSRAALRLSGEHAFDVPPLALPPASREAGQPPPSVEDLERHAAVQLFVARAQAAAHGFALTPGNAAAVAALCRRLDGLPLALELAAARTPVLPPPAMLDRLSSRLALLAGGARDLPARQQTLRSAIAWSYDLLGEPERRLFRRLSVFVGGFTLEAAAAVCAGAGDAEGEAAVVEGVGSLVGQSLVRPEDREGAAAGPRPAPLPRFEMLETIREYAAERLKASGEAEEMRWRHAAHFLAEAEAAAPHVGVLFGTTGEDGLDEREDEEPAETPPDRPAMGDGTPAPRGAATGAWLERLDAERDNLRAGLTWYREHDRPAGVRLATALCDYWRLRGHWREGRAWLSGLLPEAGATPGPAGETGAAGATRRAVALDRAGWFAWHQGDYEVAEALYAAGLALKRDLSDRPGIVASLTSLGRVAQDRGDAERALGLAEQGLAAARELGDAQLLARAHWNLGMMAEARRDYPAARALYEAGLAAAGERGNRRIVAALLCGMGMVALDQGDHAAARAAVEESLALRRATRDQRGTAAALRALGRIAAAQDDLPAARAALEEGLAIFRELGDRKQLATQQQLIGEVALAQGQLQAAGAHMREGLVANRDIGVRSGWAFAAHLEAFAALAAVQDRPERALRLGGAAAALRETVGVARRVDGGGTSERVRRWLEQARRAAGPAAPALWDAGRTMRRAQAIDYALESAASEPARAAPPGAFAPLSAREAEVAALIARGRTNRQIAAALVITSGTVAGHVVNILGKLGLRNRAQIAAWTATRDPATTG
jgi:predicted ATPase/DNA-binding CsgD family transcriptional regulator